MSATQIIMQNAYDSHYLWFQDEARKVVNAYYALEPEEAVLLANYAMRQEKNTRWALLQNLALLVPGSITHLYEEILNLNIEDSDAFFFNAPDEICNLVIRRLEADIAANRETDMACKLAWIGTPKAKEKLHELRHIEVSISKYWQSKIEDLPILAGWELTPDGRRRNLYFDDSYTLYVPDEGEIEFLNEFCPFCGQQLNVAFSFNLADERMSFLRYTGQQLKILTCVNCVEYAPVFSKPDFQANSLWHGKNKKSEYMVPSDEQLLDDWALLHKCSIREKRESPLESVAWLPSSPNHIGGLPGWVQLPEYPRCPDCHQRMKFLAQADNGSVTYAFLCPDCNTTATYSQAD